MVYAWRVGAHGVGERRFFDRGERDEAGAGGRAGPSEDANSGTDRAVGEKRRHQSYLGPTSGPGFAGRCPAASGSDAAETEIFDFDVLIHPVPGAFTAEA